MTIVTCDVCLTDFERTKDFRRRCSKNCQQKADAYRHYAHNHTMNLKAKAYDKLVKDGKAPAIPVVHNEV